MIYIIVFAAILLLVYGYKKRLLGIDKEIPSSLKEKIEHNDKKYDFLKYNTEEIGRQK